MKSPILPYLREDTDTRRILLVDLNNAIHRSAHTHAGLTAPDGRPSGALYGVIKEIKKLAIEYKLKSIICCKDAGIPDFRRQCIDNWADEGDGYKAHRKEKRDRKSEQIYQEAKAQLSYAHEVLNPLGIHVVFRKGYEADDLLGSIPAMHETQRFVVASGDKDMQQLGRMKNVRVWNSNMQEEVDRPPKNFVLVKAIVGDKSDNIPGVPGVGEKGVPKIIEMAGLQERTMPRKFCKQLREWASKQDKIPSQVQKILDNEDRLADYFRAMDLRRTEACATEATIFPGEWDAKAAMKMCKRYAFKQFMLEWASIERTLGKVAQ